MSKVYPIFPTKALLFVRVSKMRSQISSSSFSELKTIKCFEGGLKSLMSRMNPNVQNEILQIMALKVLHGIESDIPSRILGQMERDFHVYEDLPTLKILCPTRWTVRAAFLSAIRKNYGTLMKLWGWAQDKRQ